MASTPVSVREGPTTTNTLVMKRYVFWYIVMIWLSALPSTYWIITFLLGREILDAWFLFILPFHILWCWVLWVFSAILVSRLFLSVVNLLHRPREGVFERSRDDKDYRYWSLRGTIKKFGFWAAHTFPLPWLDMFAFKLFGVRAKGGTAFFDCWVDSEFIEIGDNTMLGLGAVVLSSMVVGDKLIIKRVKIGDNNLIGAHTVVAPGTVIGDNIVLGALSTTKVGQVLESGYIYTGVPCRQFKENKYAKDLAYKKTDVVETGRKEIIQDHYAKVEEAKQAKKDAKRELKALKREAKASRKRRKKSKKKEKQDREPGPEPESEPVTDENIGQAEQAEGDASPENAEGRNAAT